ncbi:CLUMA_CG008165, isoform A [Clunio marinus]|uniref:Trafficking protein particle complex subunit 1 n=1 Tax=Clunio marinus TaxID=568069 RepID=A0A1J1I8C3_9DIPT|nr:CLUMA_CG008165, isoform A [Clunio marinus]
MPSTLESCENFFASKDLYAIFEIDKTATVAEIKKAYYKHALKVHPDRVPESEKENATEKFKVLAKINEVLSDDNRRKLYDEQGIVDDDDDEKFGSTWLEAFKNIFKPISESDIDNYRKEYVGSELEKSDLKKAYVNGKGCINYMMEHVPFMGIEDEPRFHEIVNEWIKNEEVPEFKAFTKEPKSKTDRRHKKYARESKEAEKLKKKMMEDNEDDLAKQIMLRKEDRSRNFGSFLDKLAEKYGDEDDEDAFSWEDLGKKTKKGKKRSTPRKDKKETPIKAGLCGIIMTIYNLYIFDKHGTLLYYAEWNRVKQSGITKDEEAKLMYGSLFSIKSFVSKISPIDPREGFLFYKTNKYALHYFETPSGLKFVLNTDTSSTGVKEILQQLYAKIFVEYVIRNPLWTPGTPIASDLFKVKLDDFIKQCPIYGLKNI